MESQLLTAVTTFDAQSSTGTQDIVIPDLGWTPKMVKFVATVDDTTLDTALDDIMLSIGYATDDFSVSMLSTVDDNTASSNVYRGKRDDNCIIINTISGYAARASGHSGSAGPIENGWRIDWVANTGVDAKITALFYGGDDLEAELVKFAPQTSSTSHGSLSFEPNCIFFLSDGLSQYISKAVHSIWAFGVAWYDGSTIHNYSVQASNADNTGNGSPYYKISDSHVGGQYHQGSQSWSYEVTAFNTSSFTGVSSSSTGGDTMFAVCTNIGNKMKIASFSTPTNTSLDWTVSGIGFKPASMELMQGRASAFDSSISGALGGSYGFSFTDENNTFAISQTNEASADPLNTSTMMSNSLSVLKEDDQSALFDIGEVTFNSDGFTVDASEINALDGSSRLWWGIFYEPFSFIEKFKIYIGEDEVTNIYIGDTEIDNLFFEEKQWEAT